MEGTGRPVPVRTGRSAHGTTPQIPTRGGSFSETTFHSTPRRIYPPTLPDGTGLQVARVRVVPCAVGRGCSIIPVPSRP